MEGCSLALSSSVEVCPLDELSTSDTPESAGLGGSEPEMRRENFNPGNGLTFSPTTHDTAENKGWEISQN